MESEVTEENDLQEIKRKIVATDKLLKYIENLKSKNAELNTENMIKDQKLQNLQSEMDELKTSYDEKSARLKTADAQRREQANQSRQLETSVAKINCDLLNSKVEGNTLKKQIEDLILEKEALEDRLKNDVVVKRMKETYENEKWKNLAEISNLRQQNEALKVQFTERDEELIKCQVDYDDYKRLKKENCDLKKEMDENKKDRIINAMKRKIMKADTQIRRMRKHITNDQDFIYPTDHEEKDDLTLEKCLEAAMQPIEEQIKPRFPILILKNLRIQNKTNVPFLKMGDISYIDPPNAYSHKPSLSFSFFKEKPQEDSLRILNTDEIHVLESIMESVSIKRKRPYTLSSLHRSGLSTTPSGKKYQKKEHNVRGTLDPSSKDNQHFSSLKVMSIDRINSLQTIQLNTFGMDSDSDPDMYVDATESMQIPTIVSTSSLAPSDSLASGSSTAATALSSPSKRKRKSPKKPEAIKSPEKKTVSSFSSQSSGETFYNPNPSKSRQAHAKHLPMKQKTTENSQKAATKELNNRPDQMVSKEVLNSQISKDEAAKSPEATVQSESKVNGKAEKIEAPKKVAVSHQGIHPGVSSARAKLLSQGVQIETPMSVGQKLTEAQKAEVRKRMVGRAPPGIANRPSVGGFRPSEKCNNTKTSQSAKGPVTATAGHATSSSISNKISGGSSSVTSCPGTAKAGGDGLTGKPKPKGVVTDDGIPERRKTQPSRIRIQPRKPNAGQAVVNQASINQKNPLDLAQPIGKFTPRNEKDKDPKMNINNLNDELGLTDSSSDEEVDPETLMKQKQSISTDDQDPSIDSNGEKQPDKSNEYKPNRSRVIDSDSSDHEDRRDNVSVTGLNGVSTSKNKSVLDSDSSSDDETCEAKKTALAFVNDNQESSSEDDVQDDDLMTGEKKKNELKTKKRKALEEIADKVKKRKDIASVSMSSQDEAKKLPAGKSGSTQQYTQSELDKMRSSLDEDLDLSDSEEEGEIEKSTSAKNKKRIAEIEIPFKSEKVKLNQKINEANSDLSKVSNNEALTKASDVDNSASNTLVNNTSKVEVSSQKSRIETEFEANGEESYQPEREDTYRDESRMSKYTDRPRIGQKFYRNQLEEHQAGFQDRFDRNIRKLHRIRTKNETNRQTEVYSSFVTLVTNNIKLVLRDISETKLNEVCDSLMKSPASSELKEEVLCDHLFNLLMEEGKGVPLLCELNSDDPPVTRNQLRIFTFLTVICEKPGFGNTMDKMLQLLYSSFFGGSRMFNMTMSNILSLARVLVLCSRHCDNLPLIRKFLYDLFFFKSPRNHLVVLVITDLWPEVFDHKNEPLSPEQEAVLVAIFHGNDNPSREMRIGEARTQLEERHGYCRVHFVAKDLVDKYLSQVSSISNDSEYLLSLTKALVLLGRLFEYRWSHNHIMAKLFKLIDNIWASNEKKDEKLLRWALETIGLISRLYSQEGREQLEQFFKSIKDLVSLEDQLEQATLESCVKALVHLGHHLQIQVAKFFFDWNPKFSLSTDLRTKIEDFMGTRGSKHMQITINVNKQNQRRRRQNGNRGSFHGGGRGRGGRGRGRRPSD